jgi:transcriptional regulator with XRE-family HTH domain
MESAMDDFIDSEPLGSVVVAPKKTPTAPTRRTYGQQIIDALVPRYFKDRQALSHATGISYQTLQSWKNGDSEPRTANLKPISEKLGFDVLSLLRNEESRVGLVEAHPDWPAALAAATMKYGKRLPTYAFELAGKTAGAKLPDRIDAEFVYDLAEFWWKHTTDDELSRAETDAARAEVAALRSGGRGPKR